MSKFKTLTYRRQKKEDVELDEVKVEVRDLLLQMNIGNYQEVKKKIENMMDRIMLLSREGERLYTFKTEQRRIYYLNVMDLVDSKIEEFKLQEEEEVYMKDLKEEAIKQGLNKEQTVNKLNEGEREYLERNIIRYTKEIEELDKKSETYKKYGEWIRRWRGRLASLQHGKVHKDVAVNFNETRELYKYIRLINNIEEKIHDLIDSLPSNTKSEEYAKIQSEISEKRLEQLGEYTIMNRYLASLDEIQYLNKMSNHTLQGILKVDKMINDGGYYLFKPRYIYLTTLQERLNMDISGKKTPFVFFKTLEKPIIIRPYELVKNDSINLMEIMVETIKENNAETSEYNGYPLIIGYSLIRMNTTGRGVTIPGIDVAELSDDVLNALKSFAPSPNKEYHEDTLSSTIIDSMMCILYTLLYLYVETEIDLSKYKTGKNISTIKKYFQCLLYDEGYEFHKAILDGNLIKSLSLFSIKHEKRILVKCSDCPDDNYKCFIVDGERLIFIHTKEEWRKYRKTLDMLDNDYKCIKYSFLDKHCAPSLFDWKKDMKENKANKKGREVFRMDPIYLDKIPERDVKRYCIDYDLVEEDDRIFVKNISVGEKKFENITQLIEFIETKIKPNSLSKTRSMEKEKKIEFWSHQGNSFIYPLILKHYLLKYPGLKTYTVTKQQCTKLKIFNAKFRDIAPLYPMNSTWSKLKELFKVNTLDDVVKKHLEMSVGRVGKRFYDLREKDSITQYSILFYQQAFQNKTLWGSAYYGEERFSYKGGRDDVIQRHNGYTQEDIEVEKRLEEPEELQPMRNVYHLDMNSAHPFAACGLMPMRPLERKIIEDELKIAEIRDYHLYLVSTYTRCNIPILYTKDTDGESTAFRKLSRVWVWGDELKEHMKDKGTAICHEIIEYEAGRPFKEYMEYLFKIKSDSTGIMKAWAKNMMNYFYGGLGTKDRPITRICTPEEFHVYEKKYDIVDFDKTTLAPDFYIIEYVDNASKYFNKGNLVRFASKISAGTRCNLQQGMRTVGYENVLACNTDGIFTYEMLPKEMMGAGMGKWKDELNGKHIEQVQFHTKKSRTVHISNGGVEKKQGGKSKKCITNGKIDEKVGGGYVFHKSFGEVFFSVCGSGGDTKRFRHRKFHNGKSQPFEDPEEKKNWLSK